MFSLVGLAVIRACSLVLAEPFFKEFPTFGLSLYLSSTSMPERELHFLDKHAGEGTGKKGGHARIHSSMVSLFPLPERDPPPTYSSLIHELIP